MSCVWRSRLELLGHLSDEKVEVLCGKNTHDRGFHFITFENFQSPTWSRHAPANADGIFAAPLVQLLLHFLHLGRIETPQTTFARGVPIFSLQLLKAFVQGEVVAHRVLPPVRGCLEKKAGQREKANEIHCARQTKIIGHIIFNACILHSNITQ